jgi:uncharacterized membrane protein YedE/YeeE
MRTLALFVPGLLFGVGLALSGMTNPAKVINFLDVTGHWDPSLLFVMGGAVLVFTVLNQLIHRRQAPVFGGSLPGRRSKESVDARLLVGAVAFGLGWGLGGVCPGPAITDLSLLKPEVFAFVGGMLGGMIVAQRGFGVDAPKPAKPA